MNAKMRANHLSATASGRGSKRFCCRKNFKLFAYKWVWPKLLEKGRLGHFRCYDQVFLQQKFQTWCATRRMLRYYGSHCSILFWPAGVSYSISNTNTNSLLQRPGPRRLMGVDIDWLSYEPSNFNSVFIMQFHAGFTTLNKLRSWYNSNDAINLRVQAYLVLLFWLLMESVRSMTGCSDEQGCSCRSP